MGSLSYFLAGNAEKRENKKVIVSKRFKDEKGKVIPWEIRSISEGEDEELRKACMEKITVGQKGKPTKNFDSNRYLSMLAAKAVVFPDLNNAELQNSYGVMGAVDLLKVMLYKDEFDRLIEEVVNTSDTEDINDLIEEAKN